MSIPRRRVQASTSVAFNTSPFTSSLGQVYIEYPWGSVVCDSLGMIVCCAVALPGRVTSSSGGQESPDGLEMSFLSNLLSVKPSCGSLSGED